MPMPDDSPLVSAVRLMDWLAAPGPAPLLLDASFDLTDVGAGARSHREQRIPGSRHVDLEADLCGPRTDDQDRFLGRHPLRSRAEYAELMGRWGIAPDTRVVILDRQSALFAARLWWTLRWMGHADVWVLDGGLPAWRAAGGAVAGPLDADTLPPARPAYPPAAAGLPSIDADSLLQRLRLHTLIDARAPERFRGEVEPLDRLAGHIPGALNHCFKNNLQADGRFRAAESLEQGFRALLSERDPADAVHQCGSGVSACHNLLAMAAAGLPLGPLYPGSWSEWSARGEAFPKAVGPASSRGGGD